MAAVQANGGLVWKTLTKNNNPAAREGKDLAEGLCQRESHFPYFVHGIVCKE